MNCHFPWFIVFASFGYDLLHTAGELVADNHHNILRGHFRFELSELRYLGVILSAGYKSIFDPIDEIWITENKSSGDLFVWIFQF